VIRNLPVFILVISAAIVIGILVNLPSRYPDLGKQFEPLKPDSRPPDTSKQAKPQTGVSDSITIKRLLEGIIHAYAIKDPRAIEAAYKGIVGKGPKVIDALITILKSNQDISVKLIVLKVIDGIRVKQPETIDWDRVNREVLTFIEGAIDQDLPPLVKIDLVSALRYLPCQMCVDILIRIIQRETNDRVLAEAINILMLGRPAKQKIYSSFFGLVSRKGLPFAKHMMLTRLLLRVSKDDPTSRKYIKEAIGPVLVPRLEGLIKDPSIQGQVKLKAARLLCQLKISPSLRR
jgi:hypothetical protein